MICFRGVKKMYLVLQCLTGVTAFPYLFLSCHLSDRSRNETNRQKMGGQTSFGPAAGFALQSCRKTCCGCTDFNPFFCSLWGEELNPRTLIFARCGRPHTQLHCLICRSTVIGSSSCARGTLLETIFHTECFSAEVFTR